MRRFCRRRPAPHPVVTRHPDVPAPADRAADAEAYHGVAHLVGRRHDDGALFGLLSGNQAEARDQPRRVLPQQHRLGRQPREVLPAQPLGIEIPHRIGLQNRDVDRPAGPYHETVGGIRRIEVPPVDVGLGVRFWFRLGPGIGIFVGVVVVAVGARDIPGAQRPQQHGQQQQFFHFHSAKYLFIGDGRAARKCACRGP